MSASRIFFAVFSLLMLCAGAGIGETRHLTILHTNDLEGQLLGEEDGGVQRGGFAQLLALLARERGDSNSTLLIDGGDALGASPLARFDQGALVSELLARSGYDAMAVGNHEFDYGLDTLRVRTSRMAFPALAANVQVAGENPFKKWVVVERAGLRIALVGLLSPATAKVINPLRNPGLKIDAPAATLEQILPSLRDSSDYIIALVHMEEDEALELAQRFAEVDLFVAGGFRRPRTERAAPHWLQLAGGTRVLCTPGRGAYLGRIDIELERRGSLWVEQSFSARLLPVTPATGIDAEAQRAIAEQLQIFDKSGRHVLGRIDKKVENAPSWLALLLRRSARAEVGMINRGAVNELTLGDSVTLEEVRRLVRYDDFVVSLEIKGQKLAELGAQSSARSKESQQLVFSGYDVAAGTVNGRKLNNDESYLVATTAYLAEGGDAYLKPRDSAYGSGARPTLKEVVINALDDSSPAASERGARVWKGLFKLNGALSRTGIGKDAADYKDVSFLGGRSSLAWSGLFDGRLNYEMPTGRFENQIRSNYGQVRDDDNFRESSDRLQGDLTYTRQTRQPAPFVALALNSVWTVEKDQERPLNVRISAGLHQSLGRRAKVRLGLGLERDMATNETDLGLEVLPDYKTQWGDNGFSSSLKLFVGTSKSRIVSLQQYNSLSIHLGGDLNLSIDANFFAHRSSAIGSTGLKSELQIGLGYAWSDKWF
jgi:5'-nucleotidase/UDP-sugar diphosphatase